MRYCIRFFRNLPMTPDSALLYLDLPSSVSIGEAVRPVMMRESSSRQYRSASGDLQNAFEDEVYDFVLERARTRKSVQHVPVGKYKGNYTFTGGKAVGYRNLFAMSLSSFMDEDSH
ncbi:hypothetical protein V6N13_079217 [Hibiscus sabdariffa]